MNCSYCGKQIVVNTTIFEKGEAFCDTLCRYQWRKKETLTKQQPTKTSPSVKMSNETSELDFPISIKGFENRRLMVRTTFWRGPKLYLDGKLVKSQNRNLFKRIRLYRIHDNYGKEVEIKIHFRALDPIPQIYINDISFELAKPLTWYEYIWIGFPLILVFFGGAFGGLIGGGATFSNAILFRKIRNKIGRYILTGLGSIFAIMFFFQGILWINMIIQELKEGFLR